MLKWGDKQRTRLNLASSRLASGFYFHKHLVSGDATYLEADAHLDAVGYLNRQLHYDVLEPAEVWHGPKCSTVSGKTGQANLRLSLNN